MKKVIYINILALYIAFLAGCATGNSLVGFVKEGGLETKGLINLALSSSGATITVSKENPDRPASNIIDGITSSENWDQGGGWETKYEGFYSRGEYIGYGVEDPVVVMEQMRNRNQDTQNEQGQVVDADNPFSRGLRVQTRYGNIDTAMGWIVIEFPEEKTINRAVIYTVDSEKYPANILGVSDLTLQYWSDSAKSWSTVERIGRTKEQPTNSVQDNKSGVMAIRFQPIQAEKIRIVIRWTNDSKSVRKGYYQYTIGTIRVAEVEIYGYEKADTPESKQAERIASTQDINAMAEIQAIIDNYVDGYNKKDIEMVMSSISSDYLRDGETASDLKRKLESIFAQYKNLKIKLSNVKIKADVNDAIATADYNAQQDANPSSGNLVFKLSKNSGYWRIVSMDLK
jgi:hypothetical protein